MIDRDSARTSVVEFISANFGQELEVALVHVPPFETERAWVFFYNSKEYLETGNFLARLAGNGPILVNKVTGTVEALGTAGGVEKVLADYDKRQI